MEAILQSRVSALIAMILISAVVALGQSAETGNPFNKYMSPEGGVNPMSGSAAFSKSLASLSVGHLSTSFDISYSGNVFEIVQNKNDIANVGWIALGWSLGHAKIISDNAGSMWLDDDRYYLFTSTNQKFQLFKENGKWWIEGLPYWKVEQKTESKTYNSNNYAFIKGWVLTDANGIEYTYGEVDDNLIKTMSNEYTLANTKSGTIGTLKDGDNILFPNAWNLSKQKDYKDNFIIYEYDRIGEKVKIGDKETENAYTKEIYLKSVKTSAGSSVYFETEVKGKEDPYKNEYIDRFGDKELYGSNNVDTYIDPVQRKYLSKMIIKDNDANDILHVSLCYKPLKVKIDGNYNQKYVKRLLTSVVFMKPNGEKVDEEFYEYFDYDNYNKTVAYPQKEIVGADPEDFPLGAIKGIIGKNCGSIEYQYKSMNLLGVDNAGNHIDRLPLSDVRVGYLTDGTPYALGFAVSNRKKHLEAYFRTNGKWNLQQTFNDLETSQYTDTDYIIGGNDWFAVSIDKVLKIYKWNGVEWIYEKDYDVNATTKFYSFGQNYLLVAHAVDDKLKLEIPWTSWNKNGYTIGTYGADTDKNDRLLHIQLFTSANHFGLFYKDDSYLVDGRLKLFTFSPDRSTVIESNDWDGLDDDNRYVFLNDHTVIGLEESSAATYNVYRYDWSETDNKFKSTKIKELCGWQGELSIQAMGHDYVAIRHNDNDDLTLLTTDGYNWYTEIDAKNMVYNQDWDRDTEAEWNGYSGGGNFFVITRPKIKERFYGNAVMRDRYIQLIQKDENNVWNMGETIHNGTNTGTRIFIAENWYIARELDRAYIWNGNNWKTEDLSDFRLKEDKEDVLVLSEDYFLMGTKKNNIVYKKNNSFKDQLAGYFVDKKIVSDPVKDKILEYQYTYTPYIVTDKNKPIYDYVTRMPAVYAYKIHLPENGGILEKILCNHSDGTAKGQICTENVYRNSQFDYFPAKTLKYTYERYAGPETNKWPTRIFVDRLVGVSTVEKSYRTKNIEYSYLDETNGQIKSQKTSIGGKNISETKNIYAYEKYNDLKDQNRLSEIVASYQCIPNCTDGKIVSGKAVKYYTSDPYKNNPKEEWTYAPPTNTDNQERESSFGFHWNSTPSNKWVKTNEYTAYQYDKPVESLNKMGHYSSVVYEDTKYGSQIATVSNAALKEFFVISGESCDVEKIESCELKIFDKGNAIDRFKNSGTSDILYGRFSNKAILVGNGKQLKTSAITKKSGEYRFSLWAQGISNSSDKKKIYISIGSENKEFDLDGNGKWQPIEFTIDQDVKDFTLTITSNDESGVHLQDVRLIPVDASVSVAFWDKRLNKPIAQSNERSIGSFILYDEIGRVIETYVETDNYELALTKRNTYSKGSCLDPRGNKSLLATLKVNEHVLQLIPNVTQYITLKNNQDFLNFTWETRQRGEKISYRFYEEGTTPPIDWENTCCAVAEGVKKEFDGKTWNFEIFVGENYSQVYKVKIGQSTTGWIDYGNQPGIGKKPVYTSGNDISHMTYISNNGWRDFYIKGESWEESKNQQGNYQYLGSTGTADKQYLFALTDYTGNYPDYIIIEGSSSSSTYDPLGASGYTRISTEWQNNNMLETGLSLLKNYNMYRIASSEGNNPYVIYLSKENTSSALSSKTFVNDRWTESGIISELEVLDADVAVDSKGTPIVAYIGALLTKGKEEKVISDFCYANIENIETEEDLDAVPDVCIKKTFNYGDKYVVVKYLKDKSTKQWSGYSSIDGDIVKINAKELLNADKLKLASDGENTYLAVRYKENEDDDKYALSVFKLNFANNPITFDVVYDAWVSSNVPLTLEENSIFDIEVHDGVPYLMFVSKANNHNITVIKHNGSRWLSVGKPSIASAYYYDYGADLAVDKTGVPAILFKQLENSDGSDREGMIVPMKYLAEGDKDITLSSIGSLALGNLGPMFRQYLLNYTATVNDDITNFDLHFIPNKQDDVYAVQVENNGEIIDVWYNDASNDVVPSINVSLQNSYNSIKLSVIGKDWTRLDYSFTIYKKYVKPLNIIATNDLSSKVIISNIGSSSSIGGTPSSSSSIYKVPDGVEAKIVTSKDKSKICFSFSRFWKLIVSGQIFTAFTCFDYDVNKDEFILSSSSDVNPDDNPDNGSSSSSENAYFIDNNGNTVPIKIVVEKELSSSSSNPIIYEPYRYSSSSIPGTDDSNAGSSSSSGIEYNGDVIPNTAIPEEYSFIANYKIITKGNLVLADRAKFMNGAYMANNIEMGVNARVDGEMYIANRTVLRNNAYIETLITKGSTELSNSAALGSIIDMNVVQPQVPLVNFAVGSEDVNVWNNQTITMSPGKYKNMHIYSNTTVTFESGAYFFESFVIEPDARVIFKNGQYPIQFWVNGRLSFADRFTPVCEGDKNQLFIYGNTTEYVYIGVTASLSATLVLPNGNVNLAPNSVWTGAIWANNVVLQPDVILR